MQSVELLRFDTSERTNRLFSALLDGARKLGIRVTETTEYRGDSDWLLLWGPGAPDRQGPMASQVGRGGHVLAWDLAYWDRFRQLRVSFDGPHPQRYVMRRELPPTRWKAAGVNVADRWNPAGPVIVAGIGPKAFVQYGAQVTAWEEAQITECRERWSAPILYREKKNLGHVPEGATRVGDAKPIDDVLAGASLCVTWHSNVAVDAIRMGIPVVCKDGAAAAVCPAEIPENPLPLAPALRTRFLENLAWFQWAPVEAVACWSFIVEMLS